MAALSLLNVATPKQIAATGNIKASSGALLGIFVSAASATPTITVYDDAATGTTTKIVDTFTPAASAWYQIPITFTSGCYIVIGGTVSATAVVL